MTEVKKRRLRDSTSGPGTLISEGCKIEGIITGHGNFLVNGEIDGECNVDGSVTLAKNGVWKGIIRATTVIIAGTVEGDVIAAGRVEINNTARINGTISGEEIAVAEGAVVDGLMRTTGQSDPIEFTEKRSAD